MLAIHDDLRGYGLHTTGAEALGHLLAQQVAQREPDHAVHGPAGFLAMHPAHVDVVDVREGLLDGLLGDLVEADAPGAVRVELQLVGNVPGNGLAFAVGVARQQHAVGPGGGIRQFVEDVLLAAELLLRLAFGFAARVHEVAQLPALGDLDAGHFFLHRLVLAGGEVADVAVAGQHLEAVAQVLVDGLRFRGRLHDHEVVGAGGTGRGPGACVQRCLIVGTGHSRTLALGYGRPFAGRCLLGCGVVGRLLARWHSNSLQVGSRKAEVGSQMALRHPQCSGCSRVWNPYNRASGTFRPQHD